MSVILQNPSDLISPTLHETIILNSIGAERGGGMYSYATRDGVDLLLGDEVMASLLEIGPFHLIVGIDAITNEASLEALRGYTQKFPYLSVQIFLHGRNDATFHPKFCWFISNDTGSAIVGSGNLTVRGLRGNWEAFTISELSPEQVLELNEFWSQWINSNGVELKSLDDPDVILQARENQRRTRQIRRTVRQGTPPPHEEELIQIAGDYESLIAEIPRGSTRWNQANFDLETFQTFFGAIPGNQQRIVLQHINLDGSRGDIESRPSVAVRSHNYRFELAAASGLEYPDDGRPIGVFVKLAPRTFHYRLLMPSQPGYRTISTFLDENWQGRADRVRRIPINSNDLRDVWPDSPLWISLED